MANGNAKTKRQRKVTQVLEKNPFLTDEALARKFSVSIQTIRLDRLELGIPEVRERVKQMAARSYEELKSLSGSEIIGDLVELELDKHGLSVLEINEDMVFQKNGIARGHFVFAQANSLAIACINAEVALTGTARVGFKRPIRLGERIEAKAVVLGRKGNKYIVETKSRIGNETVFEGNFVIFVIDNKGESLS